MYISDCYVQIRLTKKAGALMIQSYRIEDETPLVRIVFHPLRSRAQHLT